MDNLKKYNIKLSSGKFVVVRQPTMRDRRLSNKEIDPEVKVDSQAYLEAQSEALIKYMILEIYEKDGKKMDMVYPLQSLDNIFSLQEFGELSQIVIQKGIMIDTKKKAVLVEKNSISFALLNYEQLLERYAYLLRYTSLSYTEIDNLSIFECGKIHDVIVKIIRLESGEKE